MEEIKFVLERFFYGWRMNAFVFDGQDQVLDYCMGMEDKAWPGGKESGGEVPGTAWSGGKESDGEVPGTAWPGGKESGGEVPGTAEDVNEDVDRVKAFNEMLQNEIFCAGENKLFFAIKEKAREAGIPIIYMEEDGIYYLAFFAGERLFLFGPASANGLSFVQQMSYRKRHHIARRKHQVPKVALGKSLNGVALVYYTLTGRQVTERAILDVSGVEAEAIAAANSSEMVHYEMQNIIEEKQHLPYQDELKWTLQIENGTLVKNDDRMTPENLEKLERIGTLASADSLKQFEYMAVTSTILASRAAIRGGVNAYEAYRLSEMFLQRIAKCTNVLEMIQIHSTVAEEFSRQVRLARKDRSHDCVERCKDYIANHRNKNFSLDDVAEAVGKSANYLSRVFSEQTGITLQEYACNARLEAAANMLKYSDEDVGAIAEYFNFKTQSYFGERFKKRYGVSPGKYRKQYAIRDSKE